MEKTVPEGKSIESIEAKPIEPMKSIESIKGKPMEPVKSIESIEAKSMVESTAVEREGTWSHEVAAASKGGPTKAATAKGRPTKAATAKVAASNGNSEPRVGLFVPYGWRWCMRKVVGLIGGTLLFAGPALAADLGRPPPYKAPVAPVYLFDWAGFYIGIHGGYGWGDTKFDFFTGDNPKLKGGLVGGHAGYNWQYGSVVAGLEVDFDATDIKQTAPLAFEEKTNELASARARLGYLVFPGLLAYGTAGAGWGHTEFSSHGFTVSAGNQFGWVAGAGLEYKLIEHVLLRAEYLHYDFAKTTFAPVDNVKETVDVVRAGLSYKF